MPVPDTDSLGTRPPGKGWERDKVVSFLINSQGGGSGNENKPMMGRERRALQSCAQKLSLDVITNELQIFSRLLYRNKNQHRNDQAFQQLNRV